MKLLLFVVVFMMLFVSVSATMQLSFLQNDFTCVSSNPYTLRYLGLVNGLTNSEVGASSSSQWISNFNEKTAYSTTCIPGYARLKSPYADSSEGAMYFGGFLYVSSSQEGAQFESKVFGRPNRRNTYLDSSFSVSRIADSKASTLTNIFTSLGFSEFKDSLEIMGTSYLYEDTLNSEDDKWKSSLKTTTTTFDPGVYFLQTGVEVEYDGSRNNRPGEHEIYPIRFGSDSTFDSDSDLNHVSSGYVVTNRPLTREELNSVFGEATIEATSELCVAANGEYGTDDDDGAFCCGNTDDDEGDIYSIDGEEKRCQQLSGGWTYEDDAYVCEELNGGVFELIQNLDYTALDGSDGCCGDVGDTGDFGYITADGSYLCNNDNADVTLVNPDEEEGENYWYSASEIPYRIHTQNDIDYLSNGEEWYRCRTSSSLSENEFIGLGDTLPAPVSFVYSSNTCVSIMDSLLGAGAFVNQNPPSYTHFESAANANNNEDWKCSPDADNDMVNFFSYTNPNSCVNSCYVSNGQSVRELFFTSEESQNNYCDYGVDIAGCIETTTGTSNEETDVFTNQIGDTSVGDAYPDIDCQDIPKDQGDVGYLCYEPYTICSTGDFFISQDHDSEQNEVCCRAQDGSDYYDVCEESSSQEDESVSEFADVDEDVYAEQFMCSAWNDQQRFVECCTDNIDYCFQAQSTSMYYHSDGSKNGLYGTQGSSQFLIIDFDTYNDQGILERKSREHTDINSLNPLSLDISSLTLDSRAVDDWRGFTQLEFDVRYTTELFTNPYMFTLSYDTATSSEQIFEVQLSQYLVDGTLENDWHHAIIPLPAGITSGNQITISTAETTLGIDLYLDGVYLSGHSTYENYFCSGGDIGSWVMNLDGPDDNGFGEEDTLREFGAYQSACNGINSFGWTGKLCCGDDTTTTQKENYADTQGGCFEGNKIGSETVVSSITQDENQNDLLYYDGAFRQCTNNPSDTKYASYTNQYGLYQGNDFVELHVEGDLLGNYACTGDGSWVEIGDISNTKHIASKMYGLISMEPAYSLHCDQLDTVSPLEDLSTLSYFGEENIEVFCGAQIYEQNPTSNKGNRTLVGVMLSEDIAYEDFLSAMGSYLTLLGLIDEGDQDDFTTACNLVDPSPSDEFFTCESQGNNNIRILVNTQFRIVVVSYVEDEQNDFGGLFKGDNVGDFFNNIIYFFANLFTDWYGESDDGEVDSRLPTILSENNLDLDQIVIIGEHMSNGNYKTVTGFIEELDAETDTDSSSSDLIPLVVIEYANFQTSVQPLAYRYYGEPDELNYQRGENRQVIQLNPVLANARIYSYEPDFDWRLITTALRLDSTYDGSVQPFITSQLNDGILDIGEACDTGIQNKTDDEGNLLFGNDGNPISEPFTIFKNVDGTCASYKPNIYGRYNPELQLTCIDGQIDESNCEYCGDGIVQEGEECDGGEGCSRTCLLESTTVADVDVTFKEDNFEEVVDAKEEVDSVVDETTSSTSTNSCEGFLIYDNLRDCQLFAVTYIENGNCHTCEQIGSCYEVVPQPDGAAC